MLTILLAAPAPGCERKATKPPALIVHHDQPGRPLALRRSPSAGQASTSSAQPAEQAAGQPFVPVPPRPFAAVSGPGYQGYVRPAYSQGNLEPAPAAIAALEAVLPAAAAAARARGDLGTSVDLDEYVRQYAGYDKDGVVQIDIMFICPASKHLANQDIFITGGGDCFAHVTYDTATRQFRNWRTNAIGRSPRRYRLGRQSLLRPAPIKPRLPALGAPTRPRR